MVGVPGKYKGCETCRRRRVKCSNERPYCSNCLNSGRECAGYERARVFITGTLENKGRVASHPKRVSSTSRKHKCDRSSKSSSPEMLSDFIATLPFSPKSAWDEQLNFSSNGLGCSAILTALHTGMHAIFRTQPHTDKYSPSPYEPMDLQPDPLDSGVWVNAPCCLCNDGADGGTTVNASSESYGVFLLEQLSSNTNMRMASESMVRDLGPGSFVNFPNHAFFVRVWRPLAVTAALFSRRETFLSSPAWLTGPWEMQPKSHLDNLFDIMLALPPIFSQADKVSVQPATLPRRYKAQELLQNCLLLERQFHYWLEEALQGNENNAFPFSTEPSSSSDIGFPFTTTYAFRDELTALMLLYYWMAQLLFHRCIEELHEALYEPVYEGFQEVWPDLPLGLQIDLSRFRDGGELAANICRGLNTALELSTQPDMLVAPMMMASNFYRDLQITAQEGVLEQLWLESFKDRLVAKGQGVADMTHEQKWIDFGAF